MASTRAPTTKPGAPLEHARDHPAGWYRWYVLGLLTLVSLFSVADRLVFSILTQDIKAEFDLSDAEVGLIGGLAFSIIYVIAGFPAARPSHASSSSRLGLARSSRRSSWRSSRPAAE